LEENRDSRRGTRKGEKRLDFALNGRITFDMPNVLKGKNIRKKDTGEKKKSKTSGI